VFDLLSSINPHSFSSSGVLEGRVFYMQGFSLPVIDGFWPMKKRKEKQINKISAKLTGRKNNRIATECFLFIDGNTSRCSAHSGSIQIS
jgi:hypothetical protein